MNKKVIFPILSILFISIISNGQPKGYINPAAAYCERMGYTYETRIDQNGDTKGVCILPNDSVVDAWDFYKGKVGHDYSYCKKRGYQTSYSKVDSNGVTTECAVCQTVKSGSTIEISMTDLMEQNGEPLVTPHEKSTNLIFEKAKPTRSLKTSATLPSSFDWRNYNGHSYIGGVRDQGGCGSCYSFGANACAEGTYNVANGLYDANCVNLSESFIIWCLGTIPTYNSHFSGCAGADYDYMELQALCDSGVCYESSFPYVESDPGSCTHWNDERIKMHDWYRVDCSDTTTIKTAIMTYGVVDAAVNVQTAFQNYKTGIYTDDQTTCSGSPCYLTATNHAISLVGWGHDATYGLYWILRNSWGTSWGESGYMRIKWNAARVACEVCYMDYVVPDANDPVGFKANPVSTSQIDLSWKLNANSDPVLIAWSADGTFGTPVNGVTYSVGETIPGGGTVMYYGTSTSVNHSSLNPSTTYYYKAWSNSSATYSTGVTGNATTECGAIFSFPYTENFSAGVQPNCWTQYDSLGNGEIWLFGTTTESTSPSLNGNYAYLNSDNYGSGNSQNADLISPVFDLSKYTNVVLSFNHYFQYYSPSKATLSYSVNGGSNWTTIKQWTVSSSNPEAFSRNLTSSVAGYSEVLFKWNYTGTYAWYWAIDDISLTADYTVESKVILNNMTVSGDESRCYDATDTIYVASDGNPVDFLSGSTVDLIAGKSIRIFPGFHAYSGSYLHAWITETGDFCNKLSSLVNQEAGDEKSADLIDNIRPIVPVSSDKAVRVYPNPNNGKFIVELSNFEGNTEITVINTLGAVVSHSSISGENNSRVELSVMNKGIYFVRVNNGKTVKTNKIIIQ
jgi:C1A family cysteine protease